MVCSVTTGVMSAGMSSMIRVRDERQGLTGPWHLGQAVEGVILACVDPRRRRPTTAGMSGLGPLGFGPALGGRLGVGRGLPRRGRGIGSGRRGLFLGQLLGQAQESEDDGLLALLEDQRGLLGRQLRAEQGLQGSRIQGVRSPPLP